MYGDNACSRETWVHVVVVSVHVFQLSANFQNRILRLADVYQHPSHGACRIHAMRLVDIGTFRLDFQGCWHCENTRCQPALEQTLTFCSLQVACRAQVPSDAERYFTPEQWSRPNRPTREALRTRLLVQPLV